MATTNFRIVWDKNPRNPRDAAPLNNSMIMLAVPNTSPIMMKMMMVVTPDSGDDDNGDGGDEDNNNDFGYGSTVTCFHFTQYYYHLPFP